MTDLLTKILENQGPVWLLVFLLLVWVFRIERSLLKLIEQEIRLKITIIQALKTIKDKLGIS